LPDVEHLGALHTFTSLLHKKSLCNFRRHFLIVNCKLFFPHSSCLSSL